MQRPITLIIAAVSCFAVGLPKPPAAVAQQKSLKDQLVGTWKFVSWDTQTRDGTKRIPTEGADPQGALILDSAGGLYFLLISALPKLASNQRLITTPEEDKAVAHGTFSYFGTYSANEAEKTITFRVERSSYSNQIGESKRVITLLTDDELKVASPVTTSGGTSDWVFRRAK
jgi:hypothetical protein